MNYFLLSTLTLAWLAILAGGWLGWQLARQNGRMLLRLDELEQRLNELEFGEDDALAGLPVGTEAPPFELPDLAGERKSLAQYRGQSGLLMFFNPECGFCREMMPKLAGLPPCSSRPEEAHSSDSQPSTFNSQPEDQRLVTSAATNGEFSGCRPLMLILTTGEAEKNRQFFAEHKVGCVVLLQIDGEIAKAYQVNGTPSGYLISPDGKIASELAMGAEALLALASPNFTQPSTINSQPEDERLLSSAATGDDYVRDLPTALWPAASSNAMA
jgi:peroxiredoxin